MMYADFHMHTSFSTDSETSPREQIERAIALGMQELCITDHHDYGADFGDFWDSDFTLDLPAYLEYMQKLRAEYSGRIRLRIGIELGLQCRIKDYLADFEEKYGRQVDFIIGSSHLIDGGDPYFPQFFEGREERAVYRCYFESCLERARRLDCFDVYGHVDYVVRYGPNKNKYYRYADYADVLDELLKTLIQKGKGLECNTGGFKYGLGQPNPCGELLKRYRELGGEILTIGSDAHTPEFVGYEFPRLRELLIGCGFRYYTTFAERKPVFHAL